MHILHIVHQFPPEHVGGTELYTQTLARAQVAQGHRVAIFFPSSQENVELVVPAERGADGIYLYALALGQRSRSAVFLSTFHQPAAGRAFARVLEMEKPDLVHIQHLMGLPTTLVDQIVDAGIPFLITLHDYWFPCANAQLLTNYDQTICSGPNRWINCGRCVLARAGRDSRLAAPALAPLLAYRSRTLRQVLARASDIISPSEFLRDQYVALGMPGVSISVVTHGIEIPPATVTHAVTDERPRALHIAFVGSVAWQKGVHVLIDAVNGMEENAVQLNIYGSLSRYPEYAAGLQTAAQHPGIHFAGQVERDALWERLGEADILAAPSLWLENAPLVTLEAFAAGLPIVASDLGALREHIDHGRNGLLVPPGDAGAWRRSFELLQSDPALLAQLRAGIQPVRTVEEHIAELSEIYDRIVAPR